MKKKIQVGRPYEWIANEVVNYLGGRKYQKADDKIFVCKFSKNVKSKLYNIQKSKTGGQKV